MTRTIAAILICLMVAIPVSAGQIFGSPAGNYDMAYYYGRPSGGGFYHGGHHHGGRGISPGAAAGIGLGACLLGSLLGATAASAQQPVVVQPSPPVVVQPGPPIVFQPTPLYPAPPPPPQSYGFWCANPPGYYPYIQDCYVPWRSVPTVPYN